MRGNICFDFFFSMRNHNIYILIVTRLFKASISVSWEFVLILPSYGFLLVFECFELYAPETVVQRRSIKKLLVEVSALSFFVLLLTLCQVFLHCYNNWLSLIRKDIFKIFVNKICTYNINKFHFWTICWNLANEKSN